MWTPGREYQVSFPFYGPSKLSFREAAEFVLGEVRRPLRPKEIVRLACEAGVLTTSGRTPEQTMKSKLSVDIRHRGAQSTFKRTEPGRFGLREWDEYQTYHASPYARKHKETVLVVPQNEVAELVPVQGFTLDPAVVAELTWRSQPYDRSAAEGTEAVRQLVTLVAVVVDGEILTFRRSRHNPESRLHGTWATLFGGHLQPKDSHPLFRPALALFMEMLSQRELEEELRMPAHCRLIPLGLIRDDSTRLGRQHLGFISLLTSDERFAIDQTSYALDGQYIAVASVESTQRLDDWSSIVTRYLTETHYAKPG